MWGGFICKEWREECTIDTLIHVYGREYLKAFLKKTSYTYDFSNKDNMLILLLLKVKSLDKSNIDELMKFFCSEPCEVIPQHIQNMWEIVNREMPKFKNGFAEELCLSLIKMDADEYDEMVSSQINVASKTFYF